MNTLLMEPAEREQFTVQGITGVELVLDIAGPGSRSYAFVIDWHIRVLLAAAWMIVALLILNGGLSLAGFRNAGVLFIFLVAVAPAVIYFLYHPIVELMMHGQTPGKRMAGVRVVTRDGGAPSAGAILIRNAFRLIDSLPALYVVGLAATFITAERVRIGDMAAGTLLVLDPGAQDRSLDRLGALADRHLDIKTLELVDQLLDRWSQLAVDKRMTIAGALLKRIDADAPVPSTDEELRARLVALAGR